MLFYGLKFTGMYIIIKLTWKEVCFIIIGSPYPWIFIYRFKTFWTKIVSKLNMYRFFLLSLFPNKTVMLIYKALILY